MNKLPKESAVSRRLVFTLGVSVVLLVGAIAWFTFRDRKQIAPGDRALFVESAAEVGMTWRMNYLPQEQGAKFKINLYDHGCGLAVGDIDGDGREDVYFCNQLGRNALYRNKGDGTFEEVAQEAGVALGDRICTSATFIDYDNDGRQDLFVCSTRGGNVLFHNAGHGKFQDVTDELGLQHVGHSQTAVFFDADNDGYLDLLLTNTAQWTSQQFDDTSHYWLGKGEFVGVLESPKEYNVFYRNVPLDPQSLSRGRKFVDNTEKSGLRGRGWSSDAVAFDYNDDGKMDLYVTSMFGRDQLYKNNGDGTFADVTLAVLGRTPWGSTGVKICDFNNDGRLDLSVVDMHSDMWMGLDWDYKFKEWSVNSATKKFSYLFGPRALLDSNLIRSEKDMEHVLGFRHEDVLFGNAFYRNEGGGRFSEISDQAGLETFWPWGMAVGDFDRDGYEDVFVTAGMGYPFWYWPNSLFMNQRDGTFRDRADELGVEPLPRGSFFPESINGRQAVRSSRCAVSADFRGDGRLDIVTNNFNDRPYFFRNQQPAGNYVAFRLHGTHANRNAIGAVVRLFQGSKVMTRQVQANGGYLAQSSFTQHFGLGENPQIDRIEIAWPGSSKPQIIESPASNRLHDVVEPARP